MNDIANENEIFADLFNAELKILTEIGNKYCIRHHEINKIDITDIRYYDYLLIDVYH